MKARIPKLMTKQESTERGAEVLRIVLLCICYILNRDHGFGVKRMQTVLDETSLLIRAIEHNDTWVDEIDHWAKSKGLKT